jgi:hypothetical protein
MIVGCGRRNGHVKYSGVDLASAAAFTVGVAWELEWEWEWEWNARVRFEVPQGHPM